MLGGIFSLIQHTMTRTNNATRKSAKAIMLGTVISAVYAYATHQSPVGPALMGIGAIIGLCTFVFFYSQEETAK